MKFIFTFCFLAVVAGVQAQNYAVRSFLSDTYYLSSYGASSAHNDTLVTVFNGQLDPSSVTGSNGFIVHMDKNLNVLGVKRYGDVDEFAFNDVLYFNDSLIFAAGLAFYPTVEYPTLIALDENLDSLWSFALDSLAPTTDPFALHGYVSKVMQVEKLNDSTIVCAYSREHSLVVTSMSTSGVVNWTKAYDHFDHYLLGRLKVIDNEICILSNVYGKAGLIVLDAVGNELEQFGLWLVGDASDVIKMGADWLITSHNENKRGLHRISNGTSLSQYFENNFLVISNELETARVYNWTDSTFLFTITNGTYELDTNFNLINEDKYMSGVDLIFLDSGRFVHVQSGGIFSKTLPSPNLSYQAQDSLFNGFSADMGCSVGDFTTGTESTQVDVAVYQEATTTLNIQPVDYYYGHNFITMSPQCPILSISEEEIEVTFTIYPNPTQGILHLSTSHNIEEVEVLNALGQSQNISIDDLYLLHVEHLPTGVYFVRVRMEDGQWATQRFVKE